MKSLKIKIPILIITLVVFTVICSAYVTYKISGEEVRMHIVNKNEIIANMISDQVNQYMLDAKNNIEYVAKNIDLNNIKTIYSEIDRVYSGYRWMDVLFYMTSDGRIVYSKPYSKSIENKSYVQREYYKHIFENPQTYISKVFVSSILNQPHVIIAAPIVDENQQIKGIIGGGIPLKAIQKIIDQTQKSFDGKIYAIDGDGKILVSPDRKNLFKKMELKRDIVVEGQILNLSEIMGKYEKGKGVYQQNDRKTYISFSKIKNYEGLIIVERNDVHIGKEVDKMQNQLIPWSGLILFIALLLGLYIAYNITDPIEKLVQYVRKMTKDIDKGVEDVEVTDDNEIGELEIAFNGMSEELHCKIEDLKISRERESQTKKYLKNILKSAGSGVVVIDQNEKVLIFNKAAEKITGIDATSIVGKYKKEFIKCLALPIGVFDEEYLKPYVQEKEYKLNKKDGSIVPVSMIISPIHDVKNNMVGLVCLMKDLSQIKMFEQQLKREDRLKTIGELSSSIIHEIGNPLAGITNLLEVLNENIDQKEIRKELIDAIQEEVDLLNNIVINFLDFTRMHSNQKVKVNIMHVIESSLSILKPQIRYKNIRIIQSFPSHVLHIKVDPKAIRQAFVNILKNSIEAVEQNGVISINVKSQDPLLTIMIKDNGKGLESDMMDKIFNPFFTTKEEGTGLGLSIVHKIIMDNGGNVSVNSELGKYTQFIISFKGDTFNETVDYR